MKLLGKIEESLVFEYERGRYIIVYVDEENEESRWEVTPVWSNPLGRFAWHFTKCSSDPKEQDCLDVIRENKSEIVERLNELNAVWADKDRAEMFGDVLDELDETLDSLKEGEVWTWE